MFRDVHVGVDHQDLITVLLGFFPDIIGDDAEKRVGERLRGVGDDAFAGAFKRVGERLRGVGGDAFAGAFFIPATAKDKSGNCGENGEDIGFLAH